MAIVTVKNIPDDLYNRLKAFASGNRRSILITGASSGIGKACALHLAGRGFTVYAGVRKLADADMLKQEGSGILEPVILDVTALDTIAAAVETVGKNTAQPLFGLVNNAGISVSCVLEVTPEDELRRLLDVNVVGVHAMIRAFLPMLRRQSGRIVNIGSAASFMAGPGGSSYAASKYAVRAITESLQTELQPFGMSVSLVAPGAIESDIWEKSREYREALRKRVTPEQREAYQVFSRAADAMADHIHPIPAVEVARAVEHALTAHRPKCVYLVGKDARQARMFSRLPRRWFNRLVMMHIRQHAAKE